MAAGRPINGGERNFRSPSLREIWVTAYRLARQSKRCKSSRHRAVHYAAANRTVRHDGSPRKETGLLYTRKRREGRGGPGIGFNLLWLEFQNTRWLMHIAFGSVPTSLCGRTSATFPSILPPPSISLARTNPPLPSSNGRKLILSSHQAAAHDSPPRPFSRVARFKRYLCRVNRTVPFSRISSSNGARW